MIHYVHPDNGQVFAYANEREREEYGSRELVRIADDDPRIKPQRSIFDLARIAQMAVHSQYTQRMGLVASSYPQHERESWPVQLQEARDLQVNPGAPTPWLDACAHQRGMDRADLAQRVLDKDTDYRQVSGFLTGVRQWHEACIAALAAEGEAARDKLESYNHMQGWE